MHVDGECWVILEGAFLQRARLLQMENCKIEEERSCLLYTRWTHCRRRRPRVDGFRVRKRYNLTRRSQCYTDLLDAKRSCKVQISGTTNCIASSTPQVKGRELSRRHGNNSMPCGGVQPGSTLLMSSLIGSAERVVAEMQATDGGTVA